MDSKKGGTFRIVAIVSKIIGVFAGAAMVAGKKIESLFRRTVGRETSRSASSSLIPMSQLPFNGSRVGSGPLDGSS